MNTATVSTSSAPPVLAAQRPEMTAILEQIAGCSGDEKRFLLERLLRDILGDNPEGEWTIYDAPGKAYLHLLSPLARTRLFVTPERMAIWAAQDPSKSRPLSEINALLARGNEEEIKAYLASLNS